MEREREKRRMYGQVRENRVRRDATGSSVYSHTSGELGNLPPNQGGRRGGGRTSLFLLKWDSIQTATG